MPSLYDPVLKNGITSINFHQISAKRWQWYWWLKVGDDLWMLVIVTNIDDPVATHVGPWTGFCSLCSRVKEKRNRLDMICSNKKRLNITKFTSETQWKCLLFYKDATLVKSWSLGFWTSDNIEVFLSLIDLWCLYPGPRSLVITLYLSLHSCPDYFWQYLGFDASSVLG